MAENSITFTVKAKKDGSWRILAKDADSAAGAINNAAASTDRATKAADRWSKGNKGVAQAGMNSTKAFSKMNQSMVGGGGLVGAYATLAANVFALTAAFGVLQRAAAAEQLAAGLAYTGEVAGRNLPYIADRLREITGEAVSTQEAMSSVALATSSGFSGTQIAELGKVAKGASLALGRDMTDALNRLIRGAAKLEPELLDELGIMVRLDKASEDYAAQIGTTASQLTHFQQRQAFLNAIIKEGTEAFSGVAEAIDVNPYDQLAAALSDLLKSFVTFINNAVVPLAQFFSKSKLGLIGGVLLFASTIRSTLLPGLTGAAKGFKEFAQTQAQAALEAQKNIATTGDLPKAYNQLSHSIKNGTASFEEMELAQKSLNQSATDRAANLTTLEAADGTHTATLNQKKLALQNVTNAQAQLQVTMMASIQASRASAAASALDAASKWNLKGAYTGIVSAIRFYKAELAMTAVMNGATSVSFATLKTFVYGATLSFRALGTAILVALPWLGLIGMAIGLVVSKWDEWFGDGETVKKQNEIIDSLDHLTDSANTLKGVLEDIDLKGENTKWKTWEATIRNTAGTSADLRDRLKEIGQLQINENIDKLKTAFLELAEAQKRVTYWAENPIFNKLLFGIPGKLAASAVEDLTEKTQKLDAEVNKVSVEPFIKFQENAIAAAQANKMPDKFVARLNDQLKQMQALGPETLMENINGIINPPDSSETVVSLLDSANASAEKLLGDLGKSAEKNKGPYDDILDSIDGIDKALNQTKAGTTDLTEEAKELRLALGNENDSPLVQVLKRFDKDLKDPVVTFDKLKKQVRDTADRLTKLPGIIKQQKNELKQVQHLQKASPEILGRIHTMQDNLVNSKIEELDKEEFMIKILEQEEEKATRLKEIDEERNAIKAEQKDLSTKTWETAQAQAAADKESLGLMQKAAAATQMSLTAKEKLLRLSMQEAAFADPRRKTTQLTAKEERDINAKMRDDNIKALNQEFALKMMGVEIEYTLLDAKYAYLIAQAKSLDLPTQALEDAQKLIQTTKGQVQRGLADAHIANLTGASSTTQDDEAVRNAFMASTTQGSTTFERMQNAFADENNAFSEQDFGDKVKAMSNMLQPMMDQMKEMGPEGELMASLSEGAFAMTDIFATTFQGITGDLQKMVDESDGKIKTLGQAFDAMDLQGKAKVVGQALGAVAGMIGQIAQMQAAKSKAAIAAIDKEIAAEKKRDGQSAKSVAKIKELEAKKEQMKRKAFETQKKLQLAQAVMATAAGIAMALSSLPPPWSFIMAGLTAAMGAMQISLISGMQYDGGAAQAPQAPGSVSAGKRRNSVDFAKSQSAAGELAYMRGASGIGGPENFQNAFAGKRYRAAGGTAGYVVGEQGPELFMPDRPGRIVPADDTENMAGGNAVTFNINTIDAVGVEEVLTEQQGNIIGMIRSAANEYGDPFLENIDTSIYSTPFAGYRRA